MIRAGQKLREERLKKGLSVDDIEKATKIKATFISAIEKGEYSRLPSSAYAQGFVRNYAEYLGLSPRAILALFRREFDEKRDMKVLPDSMSRHSGNLSTRSIRIRRTMLGVVGLFILFLIFIVYQFRFAIINPPLKINSPTENAMTAQMITVSGSTDSNATVTVNDQPTLVTPDGAFSKKISAFPGRVVIVVKAKSRYGKETVVERRVTVK